jgi:RNA polymerase sigma factor (sigma-70 family)
MAGAMPPEVRALLEAADPASRESAWTGFVSAYSRLFLHVARQLFADRDMAMDAYTHILESLSQDDCRRLRAYAADGRCKFTTWLVVVAQRLCLDHRRARYGRPQESTPASREAQAVRRRLVDLASEDVEPDQLGGELEDPASTLQSRELSHALLASRRALPPADQLLITLRFEDGLSAPEIARILGFPTPFHVYRRLNAVLALLRTGLRARGVEESSP